MFDKYVYVLPDVALVPRMALPCKETRAVLADVAVRAATPRDADAVVPRDVVVRDATLRGDADTPRDVAMLARDAVVLAMPRDVAVARDGATVVPRDADAPDTAARDVVARDATERDAAVVVRAVDAAVVRGLVRPDARDVPARADCGAAAAVTFIGAIGSASTARIDTNVEQTKNAAASKNTVPTAFLQKSPNVRFFIQTPLRA